MVTFSLPGDDGAADALNGTPRARPPLPFAKRGFASSSLGPGASARRNGTPLTASSRRFNASTRDDGVSAGLSNSSIATARNIFRASTFSDSPPPTTPFSPSLAVNPMKKVFAPSSGIATAAHEPARTFRQSTAQATPRGVAAGATDKELFPMRISSPPPELTGEALTNKIPKDWNSKGSIYADQFLAHLCPPDLDEEQRRQFFCVLDLRRLKYAANEVFSRKDWKLNVINFAKEFEKSRSIILLRYGLYEFQNVKPSKDVLKRWRREHGLPEPDDDDMESTPSKPAASKKRKASDDLAQDSSAPAPSAAPSTVLKAKRRAMDKGEQESQEAAVATPVQSKNKRKASVSEEQPSKLQRPTPSSARSLFEAAANRSTAAAPDAASNSHKPAPSPARSLLETIANKNAPAAAQYPQNQAGNKADPFAATNRPGGNSNSLARSVFANVNKPPAAQGSAAGSNIFGYLSDASSAKNSGVEADAESESDSASDNASPDTGGQSDEPSLAASGAAETGSQLGPGPFATKSGSLSSGSGAGGASSNPDTRESTPGRSLFDRITKGTDGHPVRAEDKMTASSADKPAAGQDQTWNPSTTPIKFAPAAPGKSLFGGTGPTSAGSLFAPKSTGPIANPGAAGQDAPPGKQESSGADEGAKEVSESDKENELQPAKKSLFEPKAPAAPSSGFNSPLFRSKDTSAEAAKPNASLFASTTKNGPKPDFSAAAIFGAPAKNGAAAAPATPAVSFGSQPAEQPKAAEPESAVPRTTSNIFGLGTASPAASLFGAGKPAATGGIFGGASSAPLFGAFIADEGGSTAAKADTLPASTGPASQPTFSFGATSTAGPAAAATTKPLFSNAKSPSTGAADGNSLFGGSPMKQDVPSPAKKAFTGGSAAAPAPMFSFGTSQAATSGGAPGAPAAPAGDKPGNNASISFGAGSSTAAGSGGFNFNFGGGGAAAGSSFNNPFATTPNTASGSGTPAGGSFSFGGNSSGPAPPPPSASGGSSLFQFGAAGAGTNGSAPAASGGSMFGGTQPPSGSATPSFGGASAPPSGTPSFSFSGAAQPQPSQGSGPVFGSSQPAPAFGGLQPPAGGSSTTGTNSPLNFGGGGSSLATTPAAGTPEPSTNPAGEGGGGGGQEEGEKQAQISLTEGGERGEETLHEVRAKALKFVPAGDRAGDGEEGTKSKSPWTTQGVGPLRLLKNEETGKVRLLLRAEPRGNVVLNRALLADVAYKADEKYVKMTTSTEAGDGFETWMIQVKTKDSARALAAVLEKHKGANGAPKID
ncbi:hypothetical protein CDD83_8688 [Cordyceps sp. RAO-2017]|nr:hypothetical protein CDD83_8688 [Cordyceps sp. RAO-2017]